MIKLKLLILTFFFSLPTAAFSWQLVDVQYNQVLSCDPGRGLYLNWGNSTSTELEVRFEDHRDGQLSMSSANWSLPEYYPALNVISSTMSIGMDRGRPGVGRLMAGWYDQDRRSRGFDMQVIIGDSSSSTESFDVGTLSLTPPDNENYYTVQFSYSNGGTCSSWLADYYFAR